MDIKILDKIYEQTMDIIDMPRIEQIKKYIELYEQFKKEDSNG